MTDNPDATRMIRDALLTERTETAERPWTEIEIERACATILDIQADVAFTLSLAGLMRREDREIAYAAEIKRLRQENERAQAMECNCHV